MALLGAQINFEKSKLPKNVLSNLSQILTELYDEPIENVGATIVDQCNLRWKGSLDPTIFVTIQTVQNLNAEFNERCVAALTQYFTKISDVPAERIFIYFLEKVYSDVATNGFLMWQRM